MNLSIGQKLGVGFAGILLVAVSVLAYNYSHSLHLNTVFLGMIERSLPADVQIRELENDTTEMMERTVRYLATGNEKWVEEFRRNTREARDHMEKFQQSAGFDNHERIAEQLETRFDRYRESLQSIIDQRRQGDGPGLEESVEALSAEYDQLDKYIDGVVQEKTSNHFDSHENRLTNHANHTFWVFIGGSGIILLLGSGISILLTYHFTWSFQQLLAVTRRLRDGDLNERVRIQSGDEFEELAESVNEMARSLEVTTVGRDKFVLAIEAGETGVWDWDLETDEVSWNDMACDIFGADIDTYDDFYNLVHPEDRDKLDEQLDQALDNQSNFKTRYRIHRASDGELRWVDARGKIQTDEQGNSLRMIGTVRDVTERLEVKRELERSQQRFQEIAENISEVFFLAEPDGTHFHYLSPAFEDIWGISPDELGENPEHWMDSVREVDRKRVREAMEHDFSSGDFDETYRIESADGETRWIHADTYPVRDESGEITRIAGVARDMTEVKELRLASQAKSEFLAQMSHDIRTPMNAIIGMADLLRDTDLNDEQSEHLSVIREAGQTLLTLINNILDLSKIEAGKLTLDEGVFSLRKLLHRIGSMLGPMAHNKQLELNLDISSQTPMALTGDEDRIRQIIVNLVGNAIKFTDEGEVNIRADYDSDEKVVHLEVEDTGVGMSREDQEMIFEDYQQLRSVAQGEGNQQGTGLGLKICQELVIMMGGSISVESEPGEGSTFSVSLPLDPADPEQVPDIESIPFDVQDLDLSSYRILVVEDNATNRFITQNVLEDWEAEVEIVTDGRAGFSRITESVESGAPYDLVVTDDRMPDINGPEMVRTVREEVGSRMPPVILLSSTDQFEAVDREHFDAILTKPASRYELANHIARILDPSMLGEQSASDPSKQPRLPTQPRVLVVEDNQQNRKVIQVYLQKEGVDLEFAHNGEEAVEKVTNPDTEFFDIVLMDMKMPKVDGYEATRTIRDWEQERDVDPVTIIALTAQAMKGDRERCLEAGCDEYLTKPIERDRLFSVMNTFLTENHSGDTEQGDEPPGDEEPKDPLAGVDDVLFDLLPEFVTDTREELARLRSAIEERSHEQLEKVAHGIKGSAGSYGFDELARYARQLEQAGEQQDSWESIDDSYDQLEEQLNYLAEEIDQRVK